MQPDDYEKQLVAASMGRAGILARRVELIAATIKVRLAVAYIPARATGNVVVPGRVRNYV
jgi:hypothetical protein